MAHKKKDEDPSASDASASDASSSDASNSSDSSDVKGKTKKKSKEKKVTKKEKKRKDKKEKKDGKRGPKSAQWKEWKEPYQPGSILNKAYQEASKKGGIEEKKLIKLITKWDGSPAFHLRILKRGQSKGFKWEVDDANGRLRILNVKKTKAA